MPTVQALDPDIIQYAKKRMSKCMFRMFQEFPFWAFLVEKCNITLLPGDNKRVSTACVDKKGNIYFNTKFFDSLSDTMVHFVLAHEVMHLLLDHHSRMQTRKGLLWNIAGDVLINEMLQEHFNNKGERIDLSSYVTAKSVGLSIDHNTVTTEQVYDLLISKPKGPKGDGSTKGEGQSGEGLGEDLVDFEPGDAVGGTNIRDRSEDAPAGGAEWAEAGLEAATRSRMAGSCPAFMERAIDALLAPVVPWHQALAYWLRTKFCRKGKRKHTFTPPNRRYLYQDVILTSRTGGNSPSIAFSIDTSGSMGPADILRGISELDAIRKLYKVPVYLLEADAQVHKATWVGTNEPIPSLLGGGGTSFVPVMDHLKEHKPNIDVLLYFTDGYGDFGLDPGFDVLWVLTSDVIPPYGHVIRVNTAP